MAVLYPGDRVSPTKVATIERPWLLGDLFNIEGWYLVGQKKNSISDGTIPGQVGDHTKLLPMIPRRSWSCAMW
jgi:hypothetical protein